MVSNIYAERANNMELYAKEVSVIMKCNISTTYQFFTVQSVEHNIPFLYGSCKMQEQI